VALSGAPLHVLAQSRSTGTAQASGAPAARHAALSGAPHASALAALDGIIHMAPELHTQLGATGQSRAAHDNTLINTQSPDDLCDSEISSEGGDEPFHLADGDSAQVITARTAAMRLRAGERQAQQRAELDGKALQRAEDDARAAGYWRRGGSPWRDLELTLSRLDVGLSRLNVSPRAEAPTALLEAKMAACAAATAVFAVIANTCSRRNLPPGLRHAHRLSTEMAPVKAAADAVLAAVNTVRAAPAPACSSCKLGAACYPQISPGGEACFLVTRAAGGCADGALSGDALNELLCAALNLSAQADRAAARAPTVNQSCGSASGRCSQEGVAASLPAAGHVAASSATPPMAATAGGARPARGAPAAARGRGDPRLGDLQHGDPQHGGARSARAYMSIASALTAARAADAAAGPTPMLNATAAGLCSREGAVAAGPVATASCLRRS